MSRASVTVPAQLWAIAAGGAVGTAARAGLVASLPAPAGTFPVAVFAANVAGALALGAFVGLSERRAGGRWWLAPFFATGLLGSFTTFSALALDVALLARPRPWLAAGYALTSVGAGVLAAAAGWCVTRPGRSR